MRQLNSTILKNGQQLPAGTVVHTDITPDLPTKEFGFISKVEENGRLITRFPDCSAKGIGANIKVYCKDCTTFQGRIVLPSGASEENSEIIDLQTGASDGPFEFGQLTVNGKKFINKETGLLWNSKQCSDFRLLQHYIVYGPSHVRQIISQRQSLGFNESRVFGMLHNITRFYPSDYPDYYSKLGSFLDLASDMHYRIQFVAFADVQAVMPDEIKQFIYYQQICAVLKNRWNIRLELVNEASQNGLDTNKFVKPTGILSSHGSQTSDQYPVTPLWDFADYHPSRSYDWPRKMHNAMEDVQDPSGVVTQSSEPMGAAEKAIGGRRDNNPKNFFDAGAVAALLTGGATGHSDQGIQSELFTGKQYECMKAFVQGMNAVSLEFYTGVYTAGHMALPPCPIVHNDEWSSRTYAKIIGNRALVVVSQRNERWQLILKDGWKFVRQYESVIELVR